MYKMYLISTEGYKNAKVDVKIVRETGEMWVSMKNVGNGIGVKNISDSVLKEIYGICETKNPAKEQIKKDEITERDIFKKSDNLSEDELNTKSNKTVYVRNDVMTTVIKRCRGEKTKGIRAIDGFKNKLMIPDSEIPKCLEFEVKSKIGKIFKRHNPLREYSVNIYEIDPYFYEHYEKKYKLIKMGVNIYYLELMFILINFY